MIKIKTNFDAAIRPVLIQMSGLSSSTPVGSAIVRTVAFDVMAEMNHRIVNRGVATGGEKIGTYSKKPIYVSAKKNVGKSFGRPLGKFYNGKRRSVFASGARAGEDHASRYFADGYFEYKTTIGRNKIGSVNLQLSGQMMNEMSVFPTSKGWGIGWSNKKLLERARFFESGEKYGRKIFGASSRELIIAKTTAETMLKDVFGKTN